jgi:hypothetical protein
MVLTTKQEIEELITILNTNKYYQRPDMIKTKDNWLEHLNKANDNYDNMPDGLDTKCKTISAMHSLNMVNLESTRMYAGTLKEILTFTKTILDKQIEQTQIEKEKEKEKNKNNVITNDTTDKT